MGRGVAGQVVIEAVIDPDDKLSGQFFSPLCHCVLLAPGYYR
jgi:hypothetical protein